MAATMVYVVELFIPGRGVVIEEVIAPTYSMATSMLAVKWPGVLIQRVIRSYVEGMEWSVGDDI